MPFITQIVKLMMSPASSIDARLRINDSLTINDPSYYGATYLPPTDAGTSHTSILAPKVIRGSSAPEPPPTIPLAPNLVTLAIRSISSIVGIALNLES